MPWTLAPALCFVRDGSVLPELVYAVTSTHAVFFVKGDKPLPLPGTPEAVAACPESITGVTTTVMTVRRDRLEARRTLKVAWCAARSWS